MTDIEHNSSKQGLPSETQPPPRPAQSSIEGPSGRSSRRREARSSFICFRLVVVTIADVFGAGFPASLAGGGVATEAGSAFGFPARVVTTAGPVSGAACFLRGGRL